MTSSPRRCTRPALGRTRPESTPRSVDLPAPFGPTRPAISPGCTWMETSESAVSPPKRTVTPSAVNAGEVTSDAPSSSGTVAVVTGSSRPPGAPARANPSSAGYGRRLIRLSALDPCWSLPHYQSAQPPAVLGQRTVGVQRPPRWRRDRRGPGSTMGSQVHEEKKYWNRAAGKTNVMPAMSAAVVERTPMVTSTASQTDPGERRELAGLERRLREREERTSDPGDRRRERTRDHLHLHDTDPRGPAPRPRSIERR